MSLFPGGKKVATATSRFRSVARSSGFGSLSLSLSLSLYIYILIYISFYKDILSSRPRIYSSVVALTRRPTQVQPLESFPNSALLLYRSLCAAMC